jgi:hypothetical protein
MSHLASYLVPFLLGLVAAVVVQVWVVPVVDTRKRREDRWEKRVDDLGELLTTAVRRSADEAQQAQVLLTYTRMLEKAEDADLERVAQQVRDERLRSRNATSAFNDLVQTRVVWLVERVISINKKSEVVEKFATAARYYRVAIMGVSDWEAAYGPPDDVAVDKAWDAEFNARKELIAKVKILADLRHPPRASPRQRVRIWRRDRKWKRERKRVNAPPDPSVPVRTVKLGPVPSAPEETPGPGGQAPA